MSEMERLLRRAIERIAEARATCRDVNTMLVQDCALCGPLAEATRLLLQAKKLDEQIQK